MVTAPFFDHLGFGAVVACLSKLSSGVPDQFSSLTQLYSPYFECNSLSNWHLGWLRNRHLPQCPYLINVHYFTACPFHFGHDHARFYSSAILERSKNHCIYWRFRCLFITFKYHHLCRNPLSKEPFTCWNKFKLKFKSFFAFLQPLLK